MENLSEILSVEKQRAENKNTNTVHIWRDGGFYRAYNWSAWLIAAFSYTEETSDNPERFEPIKVTRNSLQSGEMFCWVGFPIMSLKKYIPSSENFTPSEESHITLDIPLPETENSDYEHMLPQYEAWEATFPIQRKKPKKPHTEQPVVVETQPLKISLVLSEILSYPVESKTPMENTDFIIKLKRQLEKLF